MPTKDLIVVLDNNGAHHARTVKDFCTFNNLTLMFLPAYSSCLNPSEKIWSYAKRSLANRLARTKAKLDVTHLETMLEDVCAGLNMSHNVLDAPQKYFDKALRGIIV